MVDVYVVKDSDIRKVYDIMRQTYDNWQEIDGSDEMIRCLENMKFRLETAFTGMTFNIQRTTTTEFSIRIYGPFFDARLRWDSKDFE